MKQKWVYLSLGVIRCHLIQFSAVLYEVECLRNELLLCRCSLEYKIQYGENVKFIRHIYLSA
jgi:hypothetical protein